MDRYKRCALCGCWLNVHDDRYAVLSIEGDASIYLHDVICRERYCQAYEVTLAQIKIHRKRTRLVDPD